VSKLKGLGTNFESLVPKGVNIDLVATDSEHKIHMLPLLSIQPRQDQPRKTFNDLELEKLAQSIKEQGILQPIIVTESEQNIYTIVAGERRWRAANIVGLSTIPAIIKKVNDLEHFQLAILENVQRQDLSAIEFAISISRLHKEYQQSYEDIAKNLGKAYTTVVNTARLLKLPLVMQESIANGTISEGHGRALLSLETTPEKQKKLYLEILKNNLSVRQSEALAKEYKNLPTINSSIKNQNPKKQSQVNLKNAENLVANSLKIKKVQIKQAKTGKGFLRVDFNNDKELQAILRKF
jgi:ParB family chromosome partitioning protein